MNKPPPPAGTDRTSASKAPLSTPSGGHDGAAQTSGAGAGPGSAGSQAALRRSASGDALSGMQQVIELADGLSEVADRLRERVLEEINRHDSGSVPDDIQAAMRILFDDEMLLRQRANTLYADAAAHVIAGLGQPQAHLVALTADAARKIRRIGRIAEATSLVGGVLALAGAVASGQAGAVLPALEKIRFHSAALDALAPPPAS